MKIQFYLKFSTSFGQSLWITRNGEELGEDFAKDGIPMTYLNEDYWEANFKWEAEKGEVLRYKYFLKKENGEIVSEWGDDRCISGFRASTREITVVDTWNHAGEYENAFYTGPFQEVLLEKSKPKEKKSGAGKPTHIFKVKAPLLAPNERVCLLGSGPAMKDWEKDEPYLMGKDGNWFVASLNLEDAQLPLAYKYGIYDSEKNTFARFESGDNRILYAEPATRKINIIHDGFVRLPNDTWKGAGVSVPVFSLRTRNGFGIGEFTDLKLLVDWAKVCGMKMIQILPINDTTATYKWTDSYPYASISAFALNPIYLNIEKAAGKKNAGLASKYEEKKKELNALDSVDYEEVLRNKLEFFRELYAQTGKDVLSGEDFGDFFSLNRHWLVPYAAFCFLRDKYKTSHFEEWESFSRYDKKAIEKMSASNSRHFGEIAFHYFLQFHAHLQLQQAANYAHKNGVILKGDIPIGIYRYGCDAWTSPELYNMNMQAGAPPDDFAVKGQNWGFPTYNWDMMQRNHFEWWRRRFEQMGHYFDAFRIDHILGFFRIWSIPMRSIEGIMGRFIPALPIHINEFGERGIWFDKARYCEPFITDELIDSMFGSAANIVRRDFLEKKADGNYSLQKDFSTQQCIEEYFSTNKKSAKELKQGLFDLAANVIMFEEGSKGEQFHFRIAMDTTYSFQKLDGALQWKLKELYNDYYYRRQDDFWQKEAMHKLPYLKRATNMLICGEDLGMVPHCVPDVMKQLGILSLEIQRMPKQVDREFFHPNDAPYLSVVTPSTHDMSTVRGWWEEDMERTKRFFNLELGQWGDPPPTCESWISRAIALQHLYSPAMWCVFMLQDILGMNDKLRRKDPAEERINIPADPKHYWRYRMHMNMEDLIMEKEFNSELRQYITNSGRS